MDGEMSIYTKTMLCQINGNYYAESKNIEIPMDQSEQNIKKQRKENNKKVNCISAKSITHKF